MKKRIAIGVVLALLVAGGALAALWYREQTETKVVRGSPTVEFLTTDEPAVETRPRSVVRQVPWPMYGFDPARSHLAADFPHRPPFRTLWNVQTGGYIEFPPVVADGRVFVANQKGLFLALGTKTGNVVWRKEFARCTAAGPAVARGLVFHATMFPGRCVRGRSGAQSGFVIAMDADTGRVRWRFDTAAVESSPLVAGGLVYVGAWDQKVYALDVRTGKLRWSYDTGSRISGSAAYSNGAVYIGVDDGHVFALDARTGKLRWRASSFSRFGRREYFYATPTVAYGRVYLGNTDGTLYAFGARTGRLLWAQPAGTYVYTAAAVWQKRVFVGTYDGAFSAFDAATGDRLWRWEAPSAVHGAPTVMAGLVYFSSASGNLAPGAQRYVKRGKRGTYALDARTGRLVWRWPGMGQFSPIVADNERVYLTGSTRVLGLVPKRRPGA